MLPEPLRRVGSNFRFYLGRNALHTRTDICFEISALFGNKWRMYGHLKTGWSSPTCGHNRNRNAIFQCDPRRSRRGHRLVTEKLNRKALIKFLIIHQGDTAVLAERAHDFSRTKPFRGQNANPIVMADLIEFAINVRIVERPISDQTIYGAVSDRGCHDFPICEVSRDDHCPLIGRF